VQKGLGKSPLVPATKLANRVVVGMTVAGQETNGHVAIGGPFDATAGKNPVGVAIHQQGEHHPGGILLRSGAAMVDGEAVELQRHLLDGLDNKMHHVVLRNPIAKVRRKQHRHITMYRTNLCSHASKVAI
jgi:hypothetical protein